MNNEIKVFTSRVSLEMCALEAKYFILDKKIIAMSTFDGVSASSITIIYKEEKTYKKIT